MVILSYPPNPPLITLWKEVSYVRRGEVPAPDPAPRKSAGGGGLARGGGAGGGGDACATSITTPGSPRLPRKANYAAAASTLAAVSSVVTYNNQLNGGPSAVDCNDDDDDGGNGNGDSDGNGYGEGDGDGEGNGGGTRCNNNDNNHNIQQSTKWGAVGGRLR